MLPILFLSNSPKRSRDHGDNNPWVKPPTSTTTKKNGQLTY